MEIWPDGPNRTTTKPFQPPLPCTNPDRVAGERRMEITDEAVEDFIDLWEETYGERLSKKRAREYASQLVRLLAIVYGPQ